MAIIAMKQWTISSTTELSFIFTALIWDSNVSDMKFGWLDLFASRMSSYLNVLFTRWRQVDTLDGAGPIKTWSVSCLLFNWGFVDCSVRSSVLGSCMGVLTCTWFFTWINLNLIEVPKSSVSGTVSSCLFLWSFLSCHYFFFLSCNEVLGNIFHA